MCFVHHQELSSTSINIRFRRHYTLISPHNPPIIDSGFCQNNFLPFQSLKIYWSWVPLYVRIHAFCSHARTPYFYRVLCRCSSEWFLYNWQAGNKPIHVCRISSSTPLKPRNLQVIVKFCSVNSSAFKRAFDIFRQLFMYVIRQFFLSCRPEIQLLPKPSICKRFYWFHSHP